MLADYVDGARSEKVPFAFMPVKGQLINANAEIALSGKWSMFLILKKYPWVMVFKNGVLVFIFNKREGISVWFTQKMSDEMYELNWMKYLDILGVK